MAPGPQADPRTAADPTAAWTRLISCYCDGCSAGDVGLMLQALHPDLVPSCYQPRSQTTELDGLPYAERGYSVPGAERSAVHPDADSHGPGGAG